MRNTLKFSLLSILLCTIVFNTGYSMNQNGRLKQKLEYKKEESDEEFLSRINNIITNYSTIFDRNDSGIYHINEYFIGYNDISVQDCRRIFDIIKNNYNIVKKYDGIVAFLLSMNESFKEYKDNNFRKRSNQTEKITTKDKEKYLLCCENLENIAFFCFKYYKDLEKITKGKENLTKNTIVKENQLSIKGSENSKLKDQLNNLLEEHQEYKILAEENFRKVKEEKQKYIEEINKLKNKLRETKKKLRNQSQNLNNINNSLNNKVGYFLPNSVVQSWHYKYK